jgi:hypothetical protein
MLYYVDLLCWVSRIAESLEWLYYGMDGRGILVRFPAEAKFYLSLNCLHRPCNLPNLLFSGNVGHTVEIRRATEHFEVKNHWSYTSIPPRTYSGCTVKAVPSMSPTEQRLWCQQLIDVNWINIIPRVVAMLASWDIPSIINACDVISESFHPRSTLSTAFGIDLLHFDSSYSSTTVVYLTTLSVRQAV